MSFSTRRSIAALVLCLSSCSLVGSEVPASDVCTAFDGGAAANTALTFEATFNNNFSSCGSAGTCEVSVSGNTVSVDARAIVCPTGTNPGGTTPSPAACSVPGLAPGTYTVQPWGKTLLVVADGGGSTSCP